MKISLLCTDKTHPVNSRLHKWMKNPPPNCQVELVHTKAELSGGDILFLISCSEILSHSERSSYRISLVIHASDLPLGRGWSPLVWQIIEGSEEIILSLIEAEDKVDSGKIWKKLPLKIPNHALWDEINNYLFDAEIMLIEFAIKELELIRPEYQDADIKATYYSRRTPADSEINPHQSIASQFNLIRTCDPNRFPAFFELHGKKFKLTVEKFDG